jgi:hypothetical protein
MRGMRNNLVICAQSEQREGVYLSMHTKQGCMLAVATLVAVSCALILSACASSLPIHCLICFSVSVPALHKETKPGHEYAYLDYTFCIHSHTSFGSF